MFDIGWQEIFIVAAIAIVVVGPRDLPRILKTVMSAVKKARKMAREFQHGIDDVVREVELDDLRIEANSIATMDLDDEIKSALDPTGDMEKDMDMSDVQNDLNDTANNINSDSEPEELNQPEGRAETFGGGGLFDTSDVLDTPDERGATDDSAETDAAPPPKEAST